MNDLLNQSVLNGTPFSLSEGFFRKLEDLFPDKLPTNISCSIDDLRFLQGQQSVILKIKELIMTEEPEEHF